MEITLELTAEQGDAEICLECELNIGEAFSVLSLIEEFGVTSIEEKNYMCNFLKSYVLEHYPDDDTLKQSLTEENDANQTEPVHSPPDEAVG